MPESFVLPAILIFLAGLVAGALVAVFFSSRSKTENEEDESNTARLERRYLKIARLWRDRSGRILIEIDDKLLADPKKMNEEQNQKLIQACQDLTGLLGINAAAQNAAAEAAPQALVQTTLPVPPVVEPPQTSSARLPEVLAPPLERQPLKGATRLNRRASGQAPSQPADKKTEEKKEPPKSIVEQINDILQEILEADPEEMRSVRLVDDALHGVVVWVGVNHYEGVEAVPDTTVQALIRAAVKEWERRSEKK